MCFVKDWLQRELTEEDFDLYETVLAHRENGSQQILDKCLEILADPAEQCYWHSGTSIIYWLLPFTETTVPKMAIIARLYWCLIHDGDSMNDSENLVWSIAKDLKGVDYLSDWDPFKDPEVAKYFAEMG